MFGTLKKCFLSCWQGVVNFFKRMKECFKQAGSACCRGLTETCRKCSRCCRTCCRKEQDDPAGLELSYFLIAYWLLFWQYLSEYHFAWKSIIQWKWSHLFYNILFSLTCRVIVNKHEHVSLLVRKSFINKVMKCLYY